MKDTDLESELDGIVERLSRCKSELGDMNEVRLDYSGFMIAESEHRILKSYYYDEEGYYPIEIYDKIKKAKDMCRFILNVRDNLRAEFPDKTSNEFLVDLDGKYQWYIRDLGPFVKRLKEGQEVDESVYETAKNILDESSRDMRYSKYFFDRLDSHIHWVRGYCDIILKSQRKDTSGR